MLKYSNLMNASFLCCFAYSLNIMTNSAYTENMHMHILYHHSSIKCALTRGCLMLIFVEFRYLEAKNVRIF